MIRNIFKSNQAKFVLILAILSLIITTFKYLSIKIFFFHSILFLYLIVSLDCNLYGKCYSGVYFNVILASVITLFFICDYLGIFKKYKLAVKRLYKLYEKSNNSGINNNFKKIMFPDENEISNAYKNRKIPTIINKEFKHSTKEEEETEIQELLNSDINTINDMSNHYLNTNLI
tara:strand:+ start:11 stop:532 length:522 start_codon:yes stop_codon:yes gene_type:complete